MSSRSHFLMNRSLTLTTSLILLWWIHPVSCTVIRDPQLLEKPRSNVLITLPQSTLPVIYSIARSVFPSRALRIAALTSVLQNFSKVRQAPVLTLLGNGVVTESYWITNQLWVQNASPLMIQQLANSKLIKEIAEDKVFPRISLLNSTLGKPPQGPEWGVRKIRAHEVWNDTKGEGIVVAVIDSGVRATHSAIRNNYVGTKEYGWFDPLLNLPEPYDLSGHGTHTTGTIAGDNGVGVAPRAKWMACKGCDAVSCLQSSILACGQFVLCPHDSSKTKKDCSKAPHIVSNSWGGGFKEDYYNAVIAAWKAAGIVPFFAIGNSGPRCSSTSTPGNQKDVISVGSTEKDDTLSTFSSRGPNLRSNTDAIKPEILAPGANINSAFFLTDNTYHTVSGTSMACPHVAGAAALLMSVNPNLRYQEIMELMFETTERIINHVGLQCGDIAKTVFPNHMYGHGRLNVYRAYKKLKSDSKYLALVPKTTLPDSERVIPINALDSFLPAVGV